jgi:FkbM family methyltransferase
VAPLGHHVAVEPLPDHAAALARRFPDVTVHGCAASDTSGDATFLTWPEAPAYSSLEWVPPRPETRHVYPAGDDRAHALTVRTARLDALLPADLDVALIKIDVEGAETRVLDGAAGTLERCRPIVALEHSLACLRHGGIAGDDVYDRLSAAGLRLFSMEGDGPYARDAFRAEVESNRRWFFFAAPA